MPCAEPRVKEPEMAKSLLNPLNEDDAKKSLFGRVNSSGADKKDEKTAGSGDAEMNGAAAKSPEGAGVFSVANPLAKKVGDGDGGGDGSGGGAVGGFKKPVFKAPVAKVAISIDIAPVESNLAPPPPPPPGPPPAVEETASSAQVETPAAMMVGPAASTSLNAVVAAPTATMADVYSDAAALTVAAAEPSSQTADAEGRAVSHFAPNLNEVHLHHVDSVPATSADASASHVEHVPAQLTDAISHLQHVDVASFNIVHNLPVGPQAAVPIEAIAEATAPTEAYEN